MKVSLIISLCLSVCASIIIPFFPGEMVPFLNVSIIGIKEGFIFSLFSVFTAILLCVYVWWDLKKELGDYIKQYNILSTSMMSSGLKITALEEENLDLGGKLLKCENERENLTRTLSEMSESQSLLVLERNRLKAQLEQYSEQHKTSTPLTVFYTNGSEAIRIPAEQKIAPKKRRKKK